MSVQTALGRILGECRGLQSCMQDGDGAKKVTCVLRVTFVCDV